MRYTLSIRTKDVIDRGAGWMKSKMVFRDIVISTTLFMFAVVSVSSASHGKTCLLPAGVHPILQPLVNEEEALMEARCFVVCADNLLDQVSQLINMHIFVINHHNYLLTVCLDKSEGVLIACQ